VRIRWSEASLADLVRLARGEDEGVRGLFDLEASAESEQKTSSPAPRRRMDFFSRGARLADPSLGLTERPTIHV